MPGNIVQAGNVTPGHSAVWSTDGVLQDGGPILGSNKVLGYVFGANFNSTGDQPILLPASVSVFRPNTIIVTNASVSLTTAVGGFYSASNKGGSQIVASNTTYSTLTTPNALSGLTLTTFGLTTRFSAANLPLLLGPNGQYVLAIYLSLTTGQGAPASADVYVTGIDLSPPA